MIGSRALPHTVAALMFAAYTAHSVSKHLRMRTNGWDLGIFEQAVRAYAERRAPIAELKGPGFHLLCDHFHPILVLLAPLYMLLPSPLTLLVAQAALFAVSAIPVTRAAIAAVGPVPGTGIGLAYGLSWGVQQAVTFDFHEIRFAAPMLAFSMERLLQGRWAAATWFAAPQVLVKEELTLVVVAIGGCLLLKRAWRPGLATVALGLAAFALIYFVAIPVFNPEGRYGYLHNAAPNELNPLVRLLSPYQIKTKTLVMLLAPTALLALRSPLFLIAVPILAVRFWSTAPNHWTPGFHYNALPALIAFFALLEVLRRIRNRWLPVAVTVAVAAALLPWTPLAGLAERATWQADLQAVAAQHILRHIPDGAVVAAANRLAAQLTRRATVYDFPQYPTATFTPEWVVIVDRPELPEQNRYSATLRVIAAAGYTVVTRHRGVILFRAPVAVGRQPSISSPVNPAAAMAGSSGWG